MTQDDKKQSGSLLKRFSSFFKKGKPPRGKPTVPAKESGRADSDGAQPDAPPKKQAPPIKPDKPKKPAPVQEPAKATAKPEEPAPVQEPAKATAKPEEPAPVQAPAKATAKPEEPAPVQAPVEGTVKAKDETPKLKDADLLTEPLGRVKLEGLFAFKLSMTSFYDEKGRLVPVTALKYKPCRVTQVKTKEKDSYSAVQLAFVPQKNKRCPKPLVSHLRAGGFLEGARFVREIRQNPPKDIKPGQEVAIESLKKGDMLKISALSKGRGFAGVMKRWGFAGGKASHGSKSHRRIGSIGQHTQPGRVMPGRKMPGQCGFKKVSRLKVPVVDVLPEENMIFVKGPVPGARNTLVALKKMPSHSLSQN